MAHNSSQLDRHVSLEHFIAVCQQRIEKLFTLYLDKIPVQHLREAMQYSLFSSSKKIRPLLVYTTGQALGAPLAHLDLPACAIELIHTYSLIHDDLPAMDNAALRRGKPACHKAFGEAIAILAGDSLQALACEIVANHPAPSLATQNRLQMITVLSQASGPYGMAAGQALDIAEMQQAISTEMLNNIYQLKTGALLSASVELGILCANQNQLTPDIKNGLALFGRHIGLAFQIQDDILDMESSELDTGKPQGLDTANQKMTYPVVHGLGESKQIVDKLFREAARAIASLGSKAYLLRELAEMVLKRKR